MKFIDSSFEIIPQEAGLDGLYKHVEKVARVSYKSEDKITKDSAEKFVTALIKNQHYACLEHGTIYLIRNFPFGDKNYSEFFEKYNNNQYSRVVTDSIYDDGWETKVLYITTNWRVIIENSWEEDLKYRCEPTEYHEKRYTVKFITSIGVGREFTRHRTFSFMQESTRFCNYSKGKFENQLTFIIPQWIYDLQVELASYDDWVTGQPKEWLMEYTGEEMVNALTCEDRTVTSYVDLLKYIERDYMFYLTSEESHQLKAQEARGILPLDTKSELVMTGFAKDWIHFFNLRSYIAMTGKPHPDAMFLADELLNDFLERGYIKYEELYNRSKVVSERPKETS